MNQLHLQNDEQNQNAYAPPQTAATKSDSVNAQTVATQGVVTQTATAQMAIKPQYVPLLLGEIENLRKKRALYNLTGRAFLFASTASLVSAVYNANSFIRYLSSANYIAPDWYFFATSTLGYINPLHPTYTAQWNPGGCFYYLAAAAAFCLYKSTRIRRQITKRIQSLADTNDIRLIGSLAETLEARSSPFRAVKAALGFSAGARREESRAILLKLLPALRVSDSATLGISQKRALARALNFNDPELTLAILKAQEQIGGVEALPFVENLARGRGDVSRDWQIMEAAKECLPFLQMRMEDRQASAQLLRPVNNAVNPTDAQQLLRATPNEEV